MRIAACSPASWPARAAAWLSNCCARPYRAATSAFPPEQVTAHVEQLVLGADYGGDGYTTVGQACELARRLGLRPGLRLLDLGSGRGWPGIYLAKTSGCQAVLTDLPPEGLRVAAARAARERIAGRCAIAAADGRQLPFAAGTFDAVTHADVLCCLHAKLAVLTACRRILRRTGRMAFYSIFVAPGLSGTDRRRAIRDGPPAVATRSDYHRLLRSAGFADHHETDVTTAYLRTARQWLRRQQEFAAELAAPEPPEALTERLTRRHAAVAAIEAGLLRRSLFIATP
jgi:cyclopropane fatty-acyl-phospholipid synthase-like methyltransferase